MRNYAGSALMLIVTVVAAVGCYTINLQVSGERAAVEALRNRLVADARDIRDLQAELRTRARFPEMQRWNDSVFQMSAPAAGQFLRSPVQLASFGAAPAPAPAQPAVVYAVTAPAVVAPPPATVVQAAYRPAAEPAAPAAPEMARLIRAGYTVARRAAPLGDAAPAAMLMVAPAPFRVAAPVAEPAAKPSARRVEPSSAPRVEKSSALRIATSSALRIAMLDTPRVAPRAALVTSRVTTSAFARTAATPPAVKSQAPAEATRGPVDLLPQGVQ